MDSNDSFSLVVDGGEMAGFAGLAPVPTHGAHPPPHPYQPPPPTPYQPPYPYQVWSLDFLKLVF